MSNLTDLAKRMARRLAGVPYAITVKLSTPTESITVASPAFAVPGGLVDLREAYSTVSRVMARAQGREVAEVTVGNTGEEFTVAGPGGAFDGRVLTANVPIPEHVNSPSSDIRPIVPGARMIRATRAVHFTTGGIVQLRTLGTPGSYQVPFPVPAGLTLPVRVLEVGPLTTADAIGLF